MFERLTAGIISSCLNTGHVWDGRSGERGDFYFLLFSLSVSLSHHMSLSHSVGVHNEP